MLILKGFKQFSLKRLKTKGSSWKSIPQRTSPSPLINRRERKKERGTKHQEGRRKGIFKKLIFTDVFTPPFQLVMGMNSLIQWGSLLEQTPRCSKR